MPVSVVAHGSERSHDPDIGFERGKGTVELNVVEVAVEGKAISPGQTVSSLEGATVREAAVVAVEAGPGSVVVETGVEPGCKVFFHHRHNRYLTVPSC